MLCRNVKAEVIPDVSNIPMRLIWQKKNCFHIKHIKLNILASSQHASHLALLASRPDTFEIE